MTMDQAAVFLAGSILFAIAIIVLIGAILVVNNLLNKHWKPVRIFTPDSWKGFNPPPYHQEVEKTDKESK